jgi:hypothetical protein
MNATILYVGGGLLVLHGLLHVALIKVAFADIKPQGIAKDSLSSHWLGFGLYEAALGGILILVVASAGATHRVSFLVACAAATLCFMMAVVHFAVYRKTDAMPEKIMHWIYVVFGAVLSSGLAI